MDRNNFALRLLPSLYKAAQRVAERENCSVNQLINIALAEKLAVLDSEYWVGRRNAASANPKSNVLRQFPGAEPPVEGDEIPAEIAVRSRSRSRKTLTAGGH